MLNPPTGHMMNFKLITHRKWYISTACQGDATISTGSGKYFQHRIVVNSKLKFEYKGILVSFFLSLIFLQLSQTKKKTTSEWGEKKKESDTKLRIIPTKPTIHRQPLARITTFLQLHRFPFVSSSFHEHRHYNDPIHCLFVVLSRSLYSLLYSE